MTNATNNGFMPNVEQRLKPDVEQRLKDFEETVDPGGRLAHTVWDLKWRLQRCETPIEQILLIEITRLLTENELTRFCDVRPQIWAYFTEITSDYEPLWKVVGVRLDLLVHFKNNWPI